MRIRAFTFIEILIAMAIISIVSALGATSYRDYTDLSALNTASDEVVGVLNLAKSRAQTQVKPDNCAGSQLSGYRVSFCSQSGDCVDGHQVYRLDAVCGSSDVQVGNSYTLPGSVVFDDQNPNNVFFGVLDGSATSTNPIRLVLKDKVKEITINNQSLIAVSELNTLGPTAAPTEPVDEEIDEPPVVTVQTGFDQDTKTVSGPAGTTQFRMYWTVSGNYYSCTGDDLLSGNLEAPFGYRDITVNQTGKYTVTCAGSGGISSDSISVTCEDCPGITTFNVTPQNPINYFTPVNVSWQASSGADHCSRSGIGNIGIWQNPNVPTSGSFVSTNLTSNVTYELTCYSGPDESTSGRVSKSYLVEVKPDEILPTSGPTYVPTVTLTPSPTLGPSAVVTPTKTPTPSPTKTPTPSPTSGPPSSTPYGGTPRTIPGTLQAEDFDTGGEGLAYHDTTSGNSGDSTYRNYNVDLYDRDGGVIVGSIADGEWLLFTTNITGGTYDINFRTAASTEGRSMRILINGQLLKTIDIPSTGSTGSYQTFTVPNVTFTGGSNKLVKLEFVGGNFNLNWIEIKQHTQTSQDIIKNGTFESGRNGNWSTYASNGIDPICKSTLSGCEGLSVYQGSWSYWAGGTSYSLTNYIRQSINIPSTASSAALKFRIRITTNESTCCVYDWMKVRLLNSSNSVVSTFATYSNQNPQYWTQKTFNISSSYFGQNLKLEFYESSDSDTVTSFFVDNVELIVTD